MTFGPTWDASERSENGLEDQQGTSTSSFARMID